MKNFKNWEWGPGRGGGQNTFGLFPKNHPLLRRHTYVPQPLKISLVPSDLNGSFLLQSNSTGCTVCSNLGRKVCLNNWKQICKCRSWTSISCLSFVFCTFCRLKLQKSWSGRNRNILATILDEFTRYPYCFGESTFSNFNWINNQWSGVF